MHTIALLGAHFLEILFFIGLVGSGIVVVISFFEDLHELLGKD